jgi:Zn-dependent M28 family amino/carboxypeptidase
MLFPMPKEPAMLKLLAPAAALFALAGCVTYADQPVDETASLDVPEIAVPAISIDTMKNAVRMLSSDEFEGRMPGTVGEEKTVAFLIDAFRKAGLQPGNGDSWVQDVPLVEITGSDFAPLTITGGAQPMAFDYGEDWVGVTYREDARTTLTDSEIVFVGYGVNAPERGWNDYEGVDVRGKTVMILVNDPDFGAETLEGPFNGKAMTYYGRWTYKYEEAAAQGAAAAIIVHQTAPASYGWNVVSTSWAGAQAYAQRGPDAPRQTVMNGWVQEGVARRILAAAGQDFDTLAAAAKRPGFTAVPLGLKAGTSFANTIRTFSSQNVIAMLPGAKRPDEYVLHTAHWDHLGRCAPGEADEICNGAIDNATGTGALVTLAQAHAKAGAADRSLVFLAVTAEESGLLGADYYAANPVLPLSQTVGGVNMDALSLAGPARDVTVVGPGKSELDVFLGAALAAEGRTATPNPNPEAGYYYRSDHFAFAKRGVPMLYVDGGQDLVNGGTAAGEAYEAAYRDDAYHAPGDEYDESWDWSGVAQDLRLYYRLGRMMAQSESWPNWVAGDEFRATRDASCAGAGGC